MSTEMNRKPSKRQSTMQKRPSQPAPPPVKPSAIGSPSTPSMTEESETSLLGNMQDTGNEQISNMQNIGSPERDNNVDTSRIIMQEIADLRSQVRELSQQLTNASHQQAEQQNRIMKSMEVVVSSANKAAQAQAAVPMRQGGQIAVQTPDSAGGPPAKKEVDPPNNQSYVQDDESTGEQASFLPEDGMQMKKRLSMGDLDGKATTMELKTQELRNIFLYVENEEEEVAKLQAPFMERLEIGIDATMGFAISLNALFLGVAMDNDDDDPGIIAVNMIFFVIFISELCIKVWIHGLVGQFGPGKFSNRFDASLVGLDVAMIFFQYVISLDINPGLTKLLRIFRLAKIARLARLLRSEVFKDLLMMIQGLLGGMSTLLWALLLFVVMMYIIALVFREFFGRDKVENVTEYFDSVPRSTITVFRCAFGDCSAAGGVPIFEHVYLEHGFGYHMGLYILFVFIICVGVFNVISAIFVESTMDAAQTLMSSKKRERMSDMQLWASNVTALIRTIMQKERPDVAVPANLSDYVETVVNLDVRAEIIDKVVKDPVAKAALEELEINPEDNAYLSDILDPDNGGTITVFDLIDGIRRLRGDARRSDIVSVDLMIRSIQLNIDRILAMLESLLSNPAAAGAVRASVFANPI